MKPIGFSGGQHGKNVYVTNTLYSLILDSPNHDYCAKYQKPEYNTFSTTGGYYTLAIYPTKHADPVFYLIEFLLFTDPKLLLSFLSQHHKSMVFTEADHVFVSILQNLAHHFINNPKAGIHPNPLKIKGKSFTSVFMDDFVDDSKLAKPTFDPAKYKPHPKKTQYVDNPTMWSPPPPMSIIEHISAIAKTMEPKMPAQFLDPESLSEASQVDEPDPDQLV